METIKPETKAGLDIKFKPSLDKLYFTLNFRHENAIGILDIDGSDARALVID